MNKIKVFVKSPALVSCGYGAHAREILKSFLDDEQFDVYAQNIRWGNCSFLTEETELTKKIKHCMIKYDMAKQANDTHFDIFVHVSIPNEWEKLGTFNIGITAGIETDHVSHVWVQKANEMDLVIVPSEHSKSTLCNTVVHWENPQTRERGQFKVTKPVLVSPEGVDTEIFKKLQPEELAPVVKDLDFESSFNFLHVGQWAPGNFGEDRKNISNLVKWFIDTFKSQKEVGLVLKVNQARNSVVDYEHTLARLREIKAFYKPEEIPPIYLLHGNYTDKEMASLFNHPKIKSFISLTHGEGFGRPMLEAAACELPIIATNWSGHLDFLNKGKFSAVEFDIQEIPERAVWGDILIKGSRWACVREEDAKRRMRKMVSSYSTPSQWAKDLAKVVKEEYDLQVVTQQLNDIVKMTIKKPESAPKLNPVEALQAQIDDPEAFNVLYTMPQSTGDVFVSTAVIDGLLKTLPEGAKIYFATSPKFSNILEGNPQIHKVIPWNESMTNMDITEEVFDVVFTPNMDTQYSFSNWIRKGQGRFLTEQFANHCICEPGNYFIKEDESVAKENNLQDENYVCVHVGSGQGQWNARKFLDWQDVVDNLKGLCPGMKVVQIGASDDEKLKNIDVDLVGKTTPQQLASVLKGANLFVGIDSFPMHLAASFNTPLVALFGSSYARSTGPWYKDASKAKFILLEPENRYGCRKACYKYECIKNKTCPCINNIDAFEVVQACAKLLK